MEMKRTVIKLRNLRKEDAQYMLEWMHDSEIQKCFLKSMENMTLEDAQSFCEIASSQNESKIKNGGSVHYAIVDDNNDEYLGTISLKNIDLNSKNAEYAISTRKKAHGTGAAKKATELLIKKGFEEFDLHKIYLNVLSDNIRAVKFYEKCGFIYEGEAKEHVLKSGKYLSLKWFSIILK